MTSEAKLIGVGHIKRSGKDTVADHLVEHHGFTKMSWASLLKEGVNTWHGWDERHATGDLKEVVDKYWGYTPRYAYQNIGTNCIRDHHMRDFWVRAAMRKVNELLEAGTSVVLADTRFPNECEAVLEAGGECWRIDRPSLPVPVPPPNNAYVRLVYKFWVQVFRDSTFEYDHASETSLLDFTRWSHIIANDGTLDELYAKVDESLS